MEHLVEKLRDMMTTTEKLLTILETVQFIKALRNWYVIVAYLALVLGGFNLLDIWFPVFLLCQLVIIALAFRLRYFRQITLAEKKRLGY